MGKALEDTGLSTLKVIAVGAVIPGLSEPQNANLVVVNQLKDGN